MHGVCSFTNFCIISTLVLILSLTDNCRPRIHFAFFLTSYHFSLYIYPLLAVLPFLFFAVRKKPEDYLRNEPQRKRKNDNKARTHAVNIVHYSTRKHALKAAHPFETIITETSFTL